VVKKAAPCAAFFFGVPDASIPGCDAGVDSPVLAMARMQRCVAAQPSLYDFSTSDYSNVAVR
jgi:hypothetical protein